MASLVTAAGALILSLLPSRNILVDHFNYIAWARHYYKAESSNLKLSRDLLDLGSTSKLKESIAPSLRAIAIDFAPKSLFQSLIAELIPC
jgi:hypothetical protein